MAKRAQDFSAGIRLRITVTEYHRPSQTFRTMKSGKFLVTVQNPQERTALTEALAATIEAGKWRR